MTRNATSAGRPHGAAYLLLGLAFIFLLLLGIRTVATGDVWMHLATGRWIAEHGIPREEVFSFSAAGAPWVVDTWLYDRVLYGLWSLGGGSNFGLMILVHVLAVALAYALLVPVARAYAHGTAIAAALLLCAWLTAPVFTVGPALFAILFTSAMVFLLHRRRPLPLIWAGVLVLQALWTNMHISFLLGPIICLAFTYEAARRRKYDEDEASASPYFAPGMLALLAVAAFAVTFLNPFVTQLHAHALASWSDPMVRLTRTWISPFSAEFASPIAKHLITASLAVGALGLLTYRDRLPGGLTALAVLGAGLAVSRGSCPQLFAVLAFPFFALSLGAGGQYLLRAAEKRAPRYQELLRRAASAGTALVILYSLFVVGSGAYYRWTGSASAPGLGVNFALFPESASLVIEHEAFPERALNLPIDGSYLAWRYPDRRVFIDGRARVYDPALYGQLALALGGDPDAWDALVTEHAPEALILSCVQPGAGRLLRRMTTEYGWQLAYFDGTTAIALAPAAAPGILDPAIRQRGLDVLEEARQGYALDLADDAGAAASPRLIGAGEAFYQLEQFPEAAAAYGLLVRGAPAMSSAWLRLGVAQLRLGRSAAAAQTLAEACDRMEDQALAFLWASRAFAAAEMPARAEQAYERARYLDAEAAAAFGPPPIPREPGPLPVHQ